MDARTAFRLIPVLACALTLWASIATPTTYVVRPDGTGDFPTIQAAIDACVHGDVVELTDGTFTGDDNRDIDYLGKAITLRSQGGDPALCIVDCEGSVAQPHRGVYFHHGEGAESMLDGIAFTRGYASDDLAWGVRGCGALHWELSHNQRLCFLWQLGQARRGCNRLRPLLISDDHEMHIHCQPRRLYRRGDWLRERLLSDRQ